TQQEECLRRIIACIWGAFSPATVQAHHARSRRTPMADANLEQLSNQLLSKTYDTLNPVQKSVIDLICAEQPTGANPWLMGDERTFGERLSDRVAAVGG